MKLKILALVVMLGIVGRVDAGFYTAGQILSDCESDNVGVRNDCISYLAGIVDTTEAWVSYELLPKRFCMPDGTTLSQLKKFYIKYANEHPEDLHRPGSRIAISAFFEAFPCK